MSPPLDPPPQPARLSPADLVRVGGAGLRARPLRVVLSALGIAIGIAAMVAVVGISTSSRAELRRTLDALGTNLLTAAPGQSLFGDAATLPAESVSMVGRIGPVRSVTATGRVADTYVYRNDRIPAGETGSIAVQAARMDLPDTVGLTVGSGGWLTAATERYPAVVLGSRAAHRLGVGRAGHDRQVWLGGQAFTVVGILDPVPLAPELDTSALVGWPAATEYLGFDGHPTTIYTRTSDSAVTTVRGVLAATVNPEHPEEVQVSRPSEALAAREAADDAFTGLLLGLGAVALLVGGVGVANTMIISVLERRAEIGLRRALGATRGQIRWQFIIESQLLAALGGVGGILLGIAVTAAYAHTRGWPTVVPVGIMLGGLALTLLIGAVAGLYPALRAARLPPTQALATS
jgi:putative ABC transport system permease protein